MRGVVIVRDTPPDFPDAGRVFKHTLLDLPDVGERDSKYEVPDEVSLAVGRTQERRTDVCNPTSIHDVFTRFSTCRMRDLPDYKDHTRFV